MVKIKFTLFILICYSITYAQSDFVDVSFLAGVGHSFHVDLATFGGGAAVIDYNNDGLEDLYVTGGSVDGKLYRNLGDGTFKNEFYKAGGFPRTSEYYTQGVSAADVDKDGDKDLLITTMYALDGLRTLAPNLLYLNNGDGTFTDATEKWGLEEFTSNSQAPTFGDLNADGYPDLFIANYYSNPLRGVNIFNESTISNSFRAATDFIFLNVNGEYFIEASHIYGMEHDGFGFQGVFTDYDNDRDVDLYIVNDFGFKKTPNRMLRNEFPRTKLLDRSLNVAMNYGMNAMGVAKSDVNFDGYMDYFTTNLSTSLLTINGGAANDDFIQKTLTYGLARQQIEHPDYQGIPISWGANFFDFDNDGDEDLFVANGALNPTIRLNPNFFYENEDGIFKETSQEQRLDDEQIARGSVVFDYDNDGDLDLFVVNQFPRDPSNDLRYPTCLMYENRSERNGNNWLKIDLEGIRSEANGISSRVEVTANGKTQIREIDGGSSHLSQNSTIAHFGLADATEVEVTVKWIGGKTQTLKNVAVNQHLTIRERFTNTPSEAASQLKAFPGFFTDEVNFQYELQRASTFVLDVIDISGNVVATVMKNNGGNPRGIAQWQVPSGLLRGVYTFRLQTGDEVIAVQGVKL
ncbi:MAG: CRTAC1 family protein [Saprospiraceae bacterium]